MPDALNEQRTYAIVGHGGCGKTSLAEMLLFQAGVINRLGKIEEGTTCLDFEPEEIKRRGGIQPAFARYAWKKNTHYLIDTPGDTNFTGDIGYMLTAADGVVFTVVDEAQFRTLVELDSRKNRFGRSVPMNPRGQDTIVGTDALLANAWTANVRFAADRANTIDVNGNPINLAHDQYILIDNGSFLTAVRAGEMQHWTERSAPVQLADVPQDIDVPRVGQMVKFEKTLVEPDDELVLRASYSWKGEGR